MKKLIEKIKQNKSLLAPIIVLGISIIIFASGLTYAYFDYVAESENESSLKVTATNFDVIITNTNININNFYPIYDDYRATEANIINFTVSNQSRKMNAEYSLHLDISNIADSLKTSDFKWELVNNTTSSVRRGNFSRIIDNIIRMEDYEIITASQTINYTLRIWLSNSTITNQNYAMNGSLTSKIVLTSIAGLDNTPLSSLANFTYAIGTYDRWGNGSDIWTIDEGYILLTSYVGLSTTVNIPAAYEVNGITYNTLTFYDASNDGGTFFGNEEIEYINFLEGVETAKWNDEWIYDSISGFFDSCSSLKRVTGIPNSVTDMNYTFNNCTSLVEAPEIPSGVADMRYTFNGCANLTGMVRINAENILSTGNTYSNNYMYNIFDGTTNPITVQIKNASATLTTFNRLTHPNNVTLDTFN